MGNPGTRIAGGLVLLVAGFSFGVLVGRRRTMEEAGPASDPPHPSAATRPQTSSATASVRIEAPMADADRAALQERIRQLESELQVLREGSGNKTAAPGEGDLAERVFEDWIALSTGNIQDSEQLRVLFGRLLKLDPSSTRTFIEHFRKAPSSKSSERQAALQLAMWVGGAETADFLHILLKDSSLEAPIRDELLRELGSTGAGMFSIKRLPVDESLGSTAMTLARSRNPDERRAGAGLLGGVATPASRIELLRILSEDPDSGVKGVAIRSLSYVGDPSTRKALEPWAAQTADTSLQKAAAAAIQTLDKGPR
jgi:hypothetical protein